MHGALQQVLMFHERFHKPIGDPAEPKLRDVAFRMRLIDEEWKELQLAIDGKDKDGKPLTKEEQIVAASDALTDMLYVILGAGACWGIDLGSCFDEVHRSNMTKTAENKRGDGKVMKGPNFEPPELKEVLDHVALEFRGVRDSMGADAYPDTMGWPQPSDPGETDIAAWDAWKGNAPSKVGEPTQVHHEHPSEAVTWSPSDAYHHDRFLKVK